jgi:proteasome lid subunit RPN8/RPN11
VKTLFLDLKLRSQIEAEALAASPRECCGLMEGARKADSVSVITLHETRNIAAQPNRFEIDPTDHFRILRGARAKRTRIVGCYHSHPNGSATPSPRDYAGAGEEGFIWLIASLTAAGEMELNAFVWRSDTFQPIVIDHTAGANSTA